MDDRDVDILTSIFRHPFASDRAVGRETGVSGNTVRVRRTRLEARGVIEGYPVYPRASIFRRYRRAWAFLDVPRWALPQRPLGEVEGLIVAWRIHPRSVIAVTYDRDPSRSSARALGRLFGSRGRGPVWVDPTEVETRNDELSPIDWKVLAALIEAPRAPIVRQASLAGISPRVFRRHRDRMWHSEVFSLGPQLNLEKETGLAVFGIYASLSERADAGDLALPGLLLAGRMHRPPGAYLIGRARTLLEASEVDRRVRAIPGVRTTFLSVPAGSYYARDTLLGWVRERIAAWEPARFRSASPTARIGAT